MCWSNKSPSHVSLLLDSCVTRRKNPLIINPQDFQSACQKVKILINSCLPRCPLEWLRYKSIRAIPLIHVIFKIFEISKIFDEYLWHSHITVNLFYFSTLFIDFYFLFKNRSLTGEGPVIEWYLKSETAFKFPKNLGKNYIECFREESEFTIS